MEDPRGVLNYLALVPCPIYYNLIDKRLKYGYYRRIDVFY